MVTLGNSAGKEQKHGETPLHVPSTAKRRMTQSVSLPVPAAVGQVISWLAWNHQGSFWLQWCLRGHRTFWERNCCKGRLERDILGISRFRQLHRNNQREKTTKAVEHSNKQPGN